MRSIWQGTRVKLRPVEPDDWVTFDAWNGDDFTARRSSAIGFPESKEAVRQWVARVATTAPDNDHFRWMIDIHDGQTVGTILTHSCDRRAGTFRYGLLIAAAHHRRGYAREAVHLVLRFFFEELGYQKVSAEVHDFNHGSQRFHEHLGFTLEGRLRRAIFTGGTHHDVFVYGLLREEFQPDPPPLDDKD